MVAIHPTEPSARESSSITAIASTALNSSPPWLRGTYIRNTPAERNPSINSRGIARFRSMSSA
jgi:hypothetical protein